MKKKSYINLFENLANPKLPLPKYIENLKKNYIFTSVNRASSSAVSCTFGLANLIAFVA